MTKDKVGSGDVLRHGATVQREFAWPETDPSVAVIEMVSEEMNVEPTDIEPLYNVVDPDALDTLVALDGSNESRESVAIEFVYEGFDVVVESGGTVTITDRSPPS